MNTLKRRPISKLAAAICAAAAVIAASPASANASANSATSADIAEPVRDVQENELETGDVRFRELFARWSALDSAAPQPSGTVPAILEPSTISIPSRMPLDGARMSSGYGMRDHPVLRQRRRHNGVDLAAPMGTPVYATADGIVGRADWFSSYGLYISLDHGADLETRYAHLSRLAVAAGERVHKGDIIGYVGSTGRSTGPHLHYEVRVDGLAVNPIPYMLESEEHARMATSSADLLPGRRRAGAAGGP
ncbi:M23 family metallopeptidase [Qipengyuania sp. ASV99]|uniref:M23 family metallopeptidase n=1 Tax=Qipengyuania sp. ASV99 TaxID=3399681 RepID=UPI003A4C7201